MNVLSVVRKKTSDPFVLLDPTDPMGSARKLVETHFTRKSVRLLHFWRGQFYVYSDVDYEALTESDFRAKVWQCLEAAKRQKGDAEVVPFKPTSKRVSEVDDAMRAVTLLRQKVEPPAWIDESNDRPPASEFLVAANGLLHLPTRELWPATPALFTTASSEVKYDPEAPEPSEWLGFLRSLFPGDADSVNLIQEWFGYALTSDTSLQKILLIAGLKRGGKGVIAKILKALIGLKNVASPTLSSLSGQFALAPLIGKRLAVLEDVRLGGRTDLTVISERLLTISGEGGIEVDRKHKETWSGQLAVRFIMLTNEIPELHDASGALASRFSVLKIDTSFYGREDTHLAEKLLHELPGILNWALDGLDRLRTNGHFSEPTSSREAIKLLQDLASPITAFVGERCELDPDSTTPTNALYEAYKVWCQNSSIKCQSKALFGRDLLGAFSPAVKTYRPHIGKQRVQCYTGIRFYG